MWSSLPVKQVIATDHVSFGIGQNRKRKSHLLTVPLAHIGWIDADRDHANTARSKVRQSLLKTPQLGVAEQSPMTAIEN